LTLEDLGPFTIHYIRTHDFTAASNGRDYRVFVAAYPAPIPHLPVLYSLDANSQFGTLIETARHMSLSGELEPMMIVGIGYPGDILEIGSLRNLDFTSSFDAAAAKRAGQQLGPDDFGGAESFLLFIREDLAPAMESHYGASPTDRGIMGHSLGGNFATWALLQPEPAFQRYMIGSPALYWNDRELLRLEEERSGAAGVLEARVFVSAGELEERPDNPEIAALRMVSNTVELAGRMASRGYAGFSLSSHVFPGESHVSVIGPTIARGLRVLYQKAGAATLE
jgi:uncharacterized protein